MNMIYFKAFLVWGIIAAVEVAHGILRARLLAPRVGDLRSRQIGVFSGSVLILLIAYFAIPWLCPVTAFVAGLIGLLWFFAMLVFEFWLGRVVFKLPWERLLADFNIAKGGLLWFGMLVLLLAPFIAGKLRGLW